MNIEVRTQAEFDKAIADGHVAVCVSGSFRLTTTGTQTPRITLFSSAKLHVEAWESSQPHVVARGSSQPHVVAWGSSQPHVEAWESSQPHVVAWESSQPHVVARGYVQLKVFGRVIAQCTAKVAVLIFGNQPQVTGGNKTKIEIKTPQDWCDYYGVSVNDGIATVYKAVDDDYSTRHGRRKGVFYKPGTAPAAPDWDGGRAECGGGLHGSPHPVMALEFNRGATRFVACPVALTDMRAPSDDDGYPHKIKFAKCAHPVVEVDRYGRLV